MSNDRVRTFVKLNGRAPLPFQEYFVRGRARGKVESIELRGIEEASPPRGDETRLRARAPLSWRRLIRLSRSGLSSSSKACARRCVRCAVALRR